MTGLAELASRAVERTVGAGADHAEGYVTEATRREVRVHGEEVESLTAATQRGVGVRAWIGRRVGYSYGSGFEEAGIEAIAERAAAAARAADEDEFAAPPAPAGEVPSIPGLSDPSMGEWPVARLADLALGVERAALGSDPRIAGVEQAVYADSSDRVALASSTGVAGAFEVSSCYAYLQALAQSGDGRETGLGFGLARGPAGLDPEAIGREGADRATEMIGAEKPPSGSCPVVLDPTVAASFVALLGGALGADSVQRGRSPLAGRLGEEVAASAFILRDDGLHPDGPASSPVDGEGVPQRSTPLVRDGRLLAYLYDTYTARRGDAESTGNAGRSGYRAQPSVSASNLIVDPGPLDFQGLLREAGEGVFVSDVAGLHSGVNPVTGIFSVGASGRAIRAGELAEPLREFTVAGDLISMLAAVRAAGAAPRWVPFGASVSVPPLLIGELAVAGT
jgi:PmbA protein